MTTFPGKLIAIEGVDGSGKRTQVELLANALAQRGYTVFRTGFPNYESWFGKMVGQFLDGQFGPLELVDPRFTALLYAGDRFEAKATLLSALRDGQVVLADRYIGSNLAHQGARVSPAKRRVWPQPAAKCLHAFSVEDACWLLAAAPMPPTRSTSLWSLFIP